MKFRIPLAALLVVLALLSAPMQQVVLAAPVQATPAQRVVAPVSDPSTPSTTATAGIQAVSLVQTPTKTTTETTAAVAPQIQAVSAMLIDAKTGDILWRKNANDKRPIASTTKIMTALLAIERGSLDDTVTVRRDVLGPGRQGGIGLVAGEKIKLRDLLYALMLPSANDAAVAVADHIGGSVKSFADMMNIEAMTLGATSTHYTNPHGLDNPRHYSTARDLATIARYAFQNDAFRQFVSTKSWKMARANPKGPKQLKSHNALLFSYAGYNGGKTGYTRGARNCLVSSATRGDVELISVVLGDKVRKNIWKDSAAMLDYGFKMYEKRQLIQKDAAYKTITSSSGQEITLVASEDESSTVRSSIPVRVETQFAPEVDAPVTKGTILGKVMAYQGDKMVAESDLVARDDIAASEQKNIASLPLLQYIEPSLLMATSSLELETTPPITPALNFMALATDTVTAVPAESTTATGLVSVAPTPSATDTNSL